MATHPTSASMLKESLPEFLEVAKYCADYIKTDEKWGNFKTGGCLGYPGAVILFSIIDSIGSYYRKNREFKITVDSKETFITGEGNEHFKILNSKYFNQNLPMDFIKKLYVEFRNRLTHNNVLGKDVLMIPNNESVNLGLINNAFFTLNHEDGKIEYGLSIKELTDLCEKAITEFIKDIDIVVPNSRQGKDR